MHYAYVLCSKFLEKPPDIKPCNIEHEGKEEYKSYRVEVFLKCDKSIT